MDDYGNDLITVMDWFDYLWGYLPQIHPFNPEIY